MVPSVGDQDTGRTDEARLVVELHGEVGVVILASYGVGNHLSVRHHFDIIRTLYVTQTIHSVGLSPAQTMDLASPHPVASSHHSSFSSLLQQVHDSSIKYCERRSLSGINPSKI
jgi:hypothetical protein